MINLDGLKNLIHRDNLTRENKLLLCLAVEPDKPKSVSTIRDLAIRAGLRESKQWNLSAILGGMKGLVIRTGIGWEITSTGRTAIESLSKGKTQKVAPQVSTLRKLIGNIPAGSTREYVEEAVACFEAGHFRASVVLSWVGTLAVLYDHIVSAHLIAFNAEAKRRDARWKDAKTVDDLARMKEYDFLQILEAISIIGKSVKNELEGCLKLRNGCGHPNSLKIAEHRVSSHLEVLILNVFSVFI